MNDAFIYDFETLGQNPRTAPIVSLAAMSFSRDRLTSNPYTYAELLDRVDTIKFDVADQVKNYGKKIEKDTLEWWGKQSKEAQKQLAPSELDRPITDISIFMDFNVTKPKAVYASYRYWVYTRNNTFDPIFLEQILSDIGAELPYDWWAIRDTKSTIDGMSWGISLQDNFIPTGLAEHFIAHNPVHDIAMDVMRLQYLAQAIK